MKLEFVLLSGLAALSFSVSALAQGGAGTPPLTLNSNTNTPLSQVLKLPGGALPGTLRTNKPRYRRGRPVHLTFRIQNTGGKAVSYNFSTGQKYDVVVTDAAGTEVWDWAKGRMFTQNLSSISLKPGKSLTYSVVWNGVDQTGRNVKSGTYTLTAHLTSDTHPAVTGGFVVNNDRDPNNMGTPTQTPADTGAVRQIDTAPSVSARTTVVIL
jgi:hypothetical protein